MKLSLGQVRKQRKKTPVRDWLFLSYFNAVPIPSLGDDTAYIQGGASP